MFIDAKAKRKRQLQRELKSYNKAGLKLWLDGEVSTAAAILQTCVIREGCAYMRDFVSADDNRIIGVSFDHVTDSAEREP